MPLRRLARIAFISWHSHVVATHLQLVSTRAATRYHSKALSAQNRRLLVHWASEVHTVRQMQRLSESQVIAARRYHTKVCRASSARLFARWVTEVRATRLALWRGVTANRCYLKVSRVEMARVLLDWHSEAHTSHHHRLHIVLKQCVATRAAARLRTRMALACVRWVFACWEGCAWREGQSRLQLGVACRLADEFYNKRVNTACMRRMLVSWVQYTSFQRANMKVKFAHTSTLNACSWRKRSRVWAHTALVCWLSHGNLCKLGVRAWQTMMFRLDNLCGLCRSKYVWCVVDQTTWCLFDYTLHMSGRQVTSFCNATYQDSTGVCQIVETRLVLIIALEYEGKIRSMSRYMSIEIIYTSRNIVRNWASENFKGCFSHLDNCCRLLKQNFTL